MSQEQLLQEFAQAYEQLMGTAVEAAQRGVTRPGDTWGPREIVAHLAGWEVMASVRIPKIVAGMAPLEEADEARQAVMNDAINAAFIEMVGDQPLDTLCGILRHIYQQNVAMLRKLDESFFQPGEYVYERTKGVIEHCHEHSQQLVTQELSADEIEVLPERAAE
jgi:hypothetical protein